MIVGRARKSWATCAVDVSRLGVLASPQPVPIAAVPIARGDWVDRGGKGDDRVERERGVEGG